MSIEKSFTRQISRMERIPQRALYRQTRVAVKGVEKKAMRGLSKPVKGLNKRKFAMEFLWFFASVILSFFISFLLFYLVTNFFSEFLNMGIQVTGSVYNFFYLLLVVCFLGVYIIRIISWAIKITTSNH